MYLNQQITNIANTKRGEDFDGETTNATRSSSL